MAQLYRAQLLLESRQHRALAEIAKREGRSISDLVREIVEHHLADLEDETRKQQELQALDDLANLRQQLQEERGLYQGDPLTETREEREADIERLRRGEV